MTTLDKSVFRVTRGAYPVLHHRKLRQIVIGFEPGDVITFREKGRRHRWSLSIDGAFKIAIRCQVEADRRAKKQAKMNGGGR